MEIHGETYYIDRIKEGDKKAFTWVVDTYKDMVYTICLRMLTNETDAAEAAQEVFVKAYRYIQGFQQKSKFSTWLYRISYNHCISVIRKKTKVIDLVDEMPVDEVNESDINGLDRLSLEERRRYLQMAIEALPETDAVVVTLFYYDELSLDEIAGVTGLTSSNIRIKLHRSRKRMYQVISSNLKSEISSIL
ncbi:MAG: sigma-70 family RNA polymerase sigma factor [Bacteroidales bacterium]|nr:sigma-70 family RNA polymerase sigma factor [Bacteroidales bacterium]